ncbi:embryogenesis-associated protein EMB8-like [Malania oleifera]|uniref:embryogenesis-associated protein EMB8-like n=1 Tax=Malania oleifera TaxID=397392 RepID=UPI0025AE8DED|nr:embryogenesis-associated protein EMB8-like [Malania oleifera]
MATASLGSAAPLPSFRHFRHLPRSITPLPLPTASNRTPMKTVSSAVQVNTAALLPLDKPLVRHYHHPSLEVFGGAQDSLLPALSSLERPYDPFPLIGWNGHVETIFAALFRSLPEVRYRRECLRMSDDGVVALDWVSGDLRRLPADSPILILLPGLAGGSGDRYVKHMLVRASSNGWRVVVFNSRGCADSPVVTAKFYSAGYTDDLREVVAQLAARYPEANLYAAGWSLGANILVRYLGQDSNTCPLSGAVSLCNPFDVVVADEEFSKGINCIYDKSLASALRKIFKKHALLFEDLDGDYNIPLTANCKSVREFHEGLTVATFGYQSVDDYYSNSNSSEYIKHVRTPLLCIQAANDPIAPYRSIPREDIKENPNCLMIITPKGGHLGWVAGAKAPRGSPWTDPVVMNFLSYLESGRSQPSDFPELESGRSNSSATSFMKVNGVQQCTEGSHHHQEV